MKGLEITEESLSSALKNPDFRLDAEFHRPLPPENAAYTYTRIRNILKHVQYGISIDMNEEGIGVPIYRMNEMSNMLCNEEVVKTADLSTSEAAPFILQDKDVLFNRTNSYSFVGRTALYRAFSDTPKIFASYLIRIVPDTNCILPEYLTAYLTCRFGEADIKRRARISINQSNVNAEELKSIKIPLLPMSFQLILQARFNDAYLLLKTASKAMKRAEQLLLDSLLLSKWSPPEPLTFTRTAVEAFQVARLDAEHFQPKYLALIEHIMKHSKQCKTMDQIVQKCNRGEQPEYTDEGELSVVTSQHILESGLNYEGFDHTDMKNWDNPKFTSARIEHGDILTYTTGAKVGRTAAYIANDRALASNHVNIARLNEKNPFYVAAVMNSMIGRWQTDMWVSGSAQVELYPQDIRRFVIPFIELKVEEKIVMAIKESYYARRKAYALLDNAKCAVELAIQDNEAAAVKLFEQIRM